MARLPITLAACVLLAACTSGGTTAGPSDPATTTGVTTTTSTSTVASTDPPATDAPTTTVAEVCEPQVTAPAVADRGRDWDVTSFDGTTIRAHWFPNRSGAPAPTVLLANGWGGTGDTNADGGLSAGYVGIGALRDAGFNVLTWDPRGFGGSGGTSQFDSPDVEIRDTQVLLDAVAARPEALLDATGDPRVGMIGGSYGGAVQLLTAAVDCRVDALVPMITWNSLDESLLDRGIAKLGWLGLLVQGADAIDGDYDQLLAQSALDAAATGTLTDTEVAWWAARNVAATVGQVRAPTLLVQGTIDSLFGPAEALANYEALRDAGTEVAMVWYCGGHGLCVTPPGDDQLVARDALAWLGHHLSGDPAEPPLPGFTVVDQHGTTFVADEYPQADGEPLTGSGSGTLALEPGEPTATTALGLTPQRADDAVEVVIPAAASPSFVLGAPTVTLAYSGTIAATDRPTVVFAQLVDDTTGFVVDNQVTPIPLVLDGQEHTLTVDLEVVADLVDPGTTLTLQVFASSPAFAAPATGGTVDFRRIDVSLPVTTGLRAT